MWIYSHYQRKKYYLHQKKGNMKTEISYQLSTVVSSCPTQAIRVHRLYYLKGYRWHPHMNKFKAKLWQSRTDDFPRVIKAVNVFLIKILTKILFATLILKLNILYILDVISAPQQQLIKTQQAKSRFTKANITFKQVHYMNLPKVPYMLRLKPTANGSSGNASCWEHVPYYQTLFLLTYMDCLMQSQRNSILVLTVFYTS